MTESILRILIIEENPICSADLREMILSGSDRQYEFQEAALGATALAQVRANRNTPFDCILLEYQLPDLDALEMLAALCDGHEMLPCPVVVLTTSTGLAGKELLRRGAQDYLKKELVTPESLTRAIDNAIERFAMLTDRKKYELALRESEEKFRSLLESAPDAMVIVDHLGKIVLVNAETQRLFGYKSSELIGARVESLIPASARVHHMHLREEFTVRPLARKMGKGRQLTAVRKDGSEFPVEIALSPITLDSGVLISSSIRDISDRVLSEKAIHESESRLALGVEIAGLALAEVDYKTGLNHLSADAARLFGLAQNFLVVPRETVHATFHPDDQTELGIRIADSLSPDGPGWFAMDHRVIWPNGDIHWLRVRKQIYFAGEGSNRHPVRAMLAVFDVTSEKNVALNLEDSEIRFRRLFEAAHDGILILNATTHKITHANPFLTSLLDYPAEYFLGKELWEIGFLKDKQASVLAMQRLDEEGSIRYEGLPLEDRHGNKHPVEMVANKYEEGLHPVIQCNIRDISERRKLEKQMLSQAAELSDLHRRKDEFLAMLSHELRSPLAPIANAVQLLGLPSGVESLLQKQARGIIERQVGHLQHLVDDLLEVSRITTGRVQLRQERVAIRGVVVGAIETSRPLIDQRKHELIVTLPDETIWLNADAARLEQVVVNLLTNAAKYTEIGGRIWLSVLVEEQECVLRVRDTGVGISPSLLPKIFDLFTQAERSLDRSQGGLGIGLALVQRLTELHGGRVEVNSSLGQGSEFVIRLPLLSVELVDTVLISEIIKPVIIRPLRVLVVDDNADTVLSFSILLRASGHEVYSANDGLTAVQVASENSPDVVLLDIGLPGLNGYEVAKRIRQQPGGNDVVLVALTGYGQDTDRQLSAQSGFNHHLVKPARLEQVSEILANASKQKNRITTK
jgi:PAS domain S-box-containing protein